MKKKIGVLGLGSIGSRHYRNFEELGCQLKGYDPTVGKPNDLKWRQEIINWADAIVVATPTEQHGCDIVDCNKPMLVEKPLVSSVGEMVGASTKNVLMVGYNLRFHSCVKKAKEWFGEVGLPIWARFTCAQYSDKPPYLRDGVLLNWSHEIDLAMYLLGDAYVVGSHSMAMEGSAEYLSDLILRHDKSTCQTTVHLDYLTSPERRNFLIVGTKGSIDVDLVGRQALLRDIDGSIQEVFYGQDTFDANYIEEAKAFLDRLDGKETLGCTAAEAMNVVRICLDAKDIARGR